MIALIASLGMTLASSLYAEEIDTELLRDLDFFVTLDALEGVDPTAASQSVKGDE